MIFTKKQIKEIRKAWARADKAEQAAQAALSDLEKMINQMGLRITANYLAGDGIGLSANDDTHVYIGDFIGMVENGEDIDENDIRDYATL